MIEFFMLAFPVSGLMLAIIVFLALMFKIATQNMRRRTRSTKFLLNQFFFCLALVILMVPLITVISNSTIAVTSLSAMIARSTPIVVGALAALGCVQAFIAAMRHYPKDEPKPADVEPVSGETV